MHPALSSCLPVIAGLSYALSALFLKRATVEGGGLWRISFLITWGQALCLLPLIFVGNGSISDTHWGHVLLTSFVFFAGQLSVFAGMRYGDVSVVTPVMGIKVLVVAGMAVWIAHEKLPGAWWIAAAISTMAAVLLSGGKPQGGRSLLPGLLGGVGAAVAFAGVDIFYQLWADASGVWRFSSLVMLGMAAWSLLLLPVLEGPWWQIPAIAWRAFWPGLLATIAQCLIMAFCVVKLKGAAWANLLYSSRGVWSVALVWCAGNAFGNQEKEAGQSVMLRRLTGAGLMLAAIALVLL
jgi:drug/metabolite transporter (DMT)-like permease